MKSNKPYICPKIKVQVSEGLMQSDIGIFSMEGDSGELAKGVDLGSEAEEEFVLDYQDYSCIWDD